MNKNQICCLFVFTQTKMGLLCLMLLTKSATKSLAEFCRLTIQQTDSSCSVQGSRRIFFFSRHLVKGFQEGVTPSKSIIVPIHGLLFKVQATSGIHVCSFERTIFKGCATLRGDSQHPTIIYKTLQVSSYWGRVLRGTCQE